MNPTDREYRRIANRKAKDKKKRRKLRRRLKAEGVPPDEIERRITQRRHADRRDRKERLLHGQVSAVRQWEIYVDRLGLEEARRIYADWEPADDAGYKPTQDDPLLKGAARADGITAKVVRRPNTITEHQYRERTT